MARKKKGVKDKYYQLAKEQGYRARSCFKLIQLNRKYEFLARANCVIDLCAAPGGWLQVCEQVMPNTSERQIIGVDLLPIKPLKGCKTIVEDITTERCKKIIKKELKGRKADVVLCDGAPNVGADYSKDAFVQSELTIHAFKFAAEHLKRGGIFITKVFRSADYNSLLWAFKQLFTKVEATKPPSSRNVSAEIFVVCRNFIAPAKIDPKLFDIAHVFEDISSNQKTGELLFHKKHSKTRNRSGYENEEDVFKMYTVSEFVGSKEPLEILSKANVLKFSTKCERFKSFKITNDEILNLMKDIKVLNNTDLRNLIKWRKSVKQEIKQFEQKVNEESEAEEEERANDEGDDGEEKIQEEIEELIRLREKGKKKEKKKKNELKRKQQIRKELGMEEKFILNSEDIIDNQNMFSLNKEDKEDFLNFKYKLSDGESENDHQSEESEDEEDVEKKYEKRLENEANEFYKTKVEKENEKIFDLKGLRQKNRLEKKSKESRKKLITQLNENYSNQINETQKELIKKGEYEKLLENDDSDSESESEVQSEHATDEKEVEAKEEEDKWFQQEIFNDLKLPFQRTDKHKRQEKRKKLTEKKLKNEKKILKKEEKETEKQLKEMKFNLKSADEKKETDSKSSEKGKEMDEETIKENEKSKEVREMIKKGFGDRDLGKEENEKSKKLVIVHEKTEYEKLGDEYHFSDYDSDENAMHLSLAKMLTKKSTRRKLLDSSYNRYAFSDDQQNLPAWFVNDEKEHFRPQLPITKAMVERMKKEKLDLTNKPIKKVAEARLRKRKRLGQRLDAAKKKVSSILENEDLGSVSKSRMIQKLYKKAAKKEDNDKVYVIAQRQTKGGKVKNTRNLASKGLKGKRLKLVDKRMRSDTHNQKRKAKRRRGRGKKK